MGIGFNIFGKFVGSPEIPESKPEKKPEKHKVETTLADGDPNTEEVLKENVDVKEKNGAVEYFNNFFGNFKRSFTERFLNKDNKEEGIVKEDQVELAKEIIENETIQSRIFNNPLIQKVKNVDWKSFLKDQSLNMAIGAISGASKVALGVSGGWMATATYGLVSGGGSALIKDIWKQKKEDRLKKEALVSSSAQRLEYMGTRIEEKDRNLKGLRNFLKQEIEKSQQNLAQEISLGDAEKRVSLAISFLDLFNNGVDEEGGLILFEKGKEFGLIREDLEYIDLEYLGQILNDVKEESITALSSAEERYVKNKILLEIQEELKKGKVDMKRLARSVAVGAVMGAVSAVMAGEIMDRFDLHGVLEEKVSTAWKFAKNMLGMNVEAANTLIPENFIKVGSLTLLPKDVDNIKDMIPNYNFVGHHIDPGQNIYGYTGIARNAIKDFLNANKVVDGLINIEATPEQMLFMEDTLRRKLEEGSKELTGETISQVYELSKGLTEDQISNLQQYVDSLPMSVVDEMQEEESNSNITRKLSGLFATAVANAQ